MHPTSPLSIRDGSPSSYRQPAFVSAPAEMPAVDTLHISRAPTAHSLTTRPCLVLPVRQGEPARPSLARGVGQVLAPSLAACSDSFFNVAVTPDQFNALLQESWNCHAESQAMTLHKVRLLREEDRTRGYLDLVRELSGGEALNATDFAWIMQHRLAQQHYTVVVDNGEGVIATASLLIECKFSHSGGLAAHIEDVIVEGERRGGGLGVTLIRVLKDLSDKLGVYKVILDATEDNVPFYEHAGFKTAEIMLSFKPGEARTAQLAAANTEAELMHTAA